MGSQRAAAQAASMPQTLNDGEVEQLDFPILRVKHDLKIRFGVPIPILAAQYGIQIDLPEDTETQVVLASPIERVHYGLFTVMGQLDPFYLERRLSRRGWHLATTRILLHFAHYIPVRTMHTDVCGMGSRYCMNKTMVYPRLLIEEGTWKLGARPYNPNRDADPLLFLAWC